MREPTLLIALAVVSGGLAGIILAAIFSRRHRRFMMRWTLEVERHDDNTGEDGGDRDAPPDRGTDRGRLE